MLSPQAPVNEERTSPVGLEEHLPAIWIDPLWRGCWMNARECDSELTASGLFELGGSTPTVVAIRPHASGHRESGILENRRDRTRRRSDIRTPLADVVQQGRLDGLVVIRQLRFHTLSNGDGVSLIGEALLPEEICTGAREAFMHVALLLGTQRARGQVSEEPKNKMAGRLEPTRHEAALHPTQRRAAGRYSMRSGSISSPHVSQTP